MNSIKSNFSRNIAYLVVFLLLFKPLHAQNAFTVYNTTNSSIPDNSVNALELGPDGRLWVGTDYGLSVFDGSNWTTYQAGSSGLPANSVRSIAVDDTGSVWVGTFGGGLSMFDGANWQTWSTSNSVLPGDHVRCLEADKAGGMWIGTTSGLARLRAGAMDAWDFLAMGSESNNVASIAVLDTELVWLGMVNGGLIYLSDTGFVDYTINNSGLTDNTIVGLALENDDPWMATPANGITFFWNLAFISYHPINSNNPSYSFSSIAREPSGKIWAGSIDKGLVYYDRQDWRYFSTLNSAIPQDYLRCVVVDDVAGTVWAGTLSAGLVKVDRQLALDVGQMGGSKSLAVYPNPCEGEMHIQLTGAKEVAFTLRDLQGRKLLEGMARTGESVHSLNGISPGLYTLDYAGLEGARSQKLLVR